MSTIASVTILAISAIISCGTQASPGRAPLRESDLRHLVHEGHAGATKASGTVDAVDAAKRKVTLSHGAIKSLGWPAMTIGLRSGQGRRSQHDRSEEHTSELQSLRHLVCRLLL